MKRASVIGGGPAGLMAAEQMAKAGLAVTVYEAKPSVGRKFLMAGKSGLNITFDGDFAKLLSGYRAGADVLHPALRAFDNHALRTWVEDLGVSTFVGSTGRVFPVQMKASPLLRAWLARLRSMGVSVRTRSRCMGLVGTNPVVNGEEISSDVTVLACGGGSWGRLGSDGTWTAWVDKRTAPFQPSNSAVEVAWSAPVAHHFGSAVKSVAWTAGALQSRGEAVVTSTGLEGGGIYALTSALRAGEPLTVDVLPDWSLNALEKHLGERNTKQTFAKFLTSKLRMTPVKRALLFEATKGVPYQHAQQLAALIKSVPIAMRGLAPLDAAISTVGGLRLEDLNNGLMITDRPGVFCAGEMLDWDAITGGWLLTACFATGAWAGQHAGRWVG